MYLFHSLSDGSIQCVPINVYTINTQFTPLHKIQPLITATNHFNTMHGAVNMRNNYNNIHTNIYHPQHVKLRLFAVD